MEKHYEEALPEGYVEAKTVDAKDKKTILLMTLGSTAITAAGIALSFFIIRPQDFFGNYSIFRWGVACGVMFVYIVLHELTHGAAYKLLTGRKLTFGITLSAAYCGVPDIYVYRKAAMISLLAPFTVFSVVFLAAALLFRDPWDKLFAAVVFSVHFGGCIGDLYNTVLYLFRFRDPRTLMRDTGPKQTFYVPEE